MTGHAGAAACGFVIEPHEEGGRLDAVLAGRLEESRSRAAARIASGEVTVDGVAAVKAQRLVAGQVVEVAARGDRPASPPPPLPPIRWRDEHLLVVAKPAGLVVHAGAGHADDTLVEALRAHRIPLAELPPEQGGQPDRPGIVHRLDRDTSGLLVVASTVAAHAGLVAALARRAAGRHYLALVEGTPEQGRGRIEGPLGRDPADRTRFAVVADGRDAVTRYVVLGEGEVATAERGRRAVTLLGCALETGRTHQIRVHLAALGHPVAGDARYGASRDVTAALGLSGQALHAAWLAFDHPVTGERIACHEPPPEALARALERAGIAIPDAGPLVPS